MSRSYEKPAITASLPLDGLDWMPAESLLAHLHFLHVMT